MFGYGPLFLFCPFFPPRQAPTIPNGVSCTARTSIKVHACTRMQACAHARAHACLTACLPSMLASPECEVIATRRRESAPTTPFDHYRAPATSLFDIVWLVAFLTADGCMVDGSGEGELLQSLKTRTRETVHA